jgi:antitoxin CcdA
MPSVRSYDRDAPRRAVNLSLNEDLVTRARRLTGNLSATVESLLADFVEREHEQRHGFLSDEFSSL